MSEVVCSLCPCRLDWNEVAAEELLCNACGHSLDDDHAAAASAPSPEGLEERALPLPIFVGRRVI